MLSLHFTVIGVAFLAPKHPSKPYSVFPLYEIYFELAFNSIGKLTTPFLVSTCLLQMSVVVPLIIEIHYTYLLG